EGFSGLDEFLELLRQLAPKSGGEDRPGPNVIAGGESARNHEEVEIVQGALHRRGHVSGQLLQMHLFGLGPQMPEEGHRLLFTVRPLDVDNATRMSPRFMRPRPASESFRSTPSALRESPETSTDDPCRDATKSHLSCRGRSQGSPP